MVFVVVQSLSHVRLFATPWTEAYQVSLSLSVSQSLLKFMSITLVMPYNHLILSLSFSFCLQSFPASVSFPMSQLFASGGQSVGASASATVFYQLCIQNNLHLFYLYSRNTLCYCTSLSNSAFSISHW